MPTARERQVEHDGRLEVAPVLEHEDPFRLERDVERAVLVGDGDGAVGVDARPAVRCRRVHRSSATRRCRPERPVAAGAVSGVVAEVVSAGVVSATVVPELSSSELPHPARRTTTETERDGARAGMAGEGVLFTYPTLTYEVHLLPVGGGVASDEPGCDDR